MEVQHEEAGRMACLLLCDSVPMQVRAGSKRDLLVPRAVVRETCYFAVGLTQRITLY